MKNIIKYFASKLFRKKKRIVSIEELMSRNDKIRELYKKNDAVIQKDDKAKKEPLNKECPNCHIKNASIVICKKCGKKGCKECFIYNPIDESYYCEDCW